MLKRLYILTLALFVLVLPAVAQNARIEQQRRKIAQLEKSIANEEKQLARLKQNKASVEQQIVSLTRQIEERNVLVKETEEQIKELTVEVEASEARLSQLSGQLADLEQNLGDIVRAAYRNYRYQNNLTYIFSAKSFTEMAQRIALLRVATLYRYNQITEVAAARSDVQAERNILGQRRTELSEIKRQLDRQRAKLQANVKEAKREINKLSNKHRDVLQAKMGHEKELNKEINELRKLVKGNKTGGSFSDKLTGLNLPVEKGKVKSYKGNMAEITGAEGAAVYSIYEGKVIQITRNKVTNKYDVFIAHGEYITSYANLSEVSVTKDAVVKTGGRIGTIGAAVNITTMEVEYKIVFGIYAPTTDVTLSAVECFSK